MIVAFLVLAGPLLANEKLVQVYAPEPLIESGLLKYALPRFSLKTQVRVAYLPSADGADLVFGDDGRAVFQGPDQVWHLDIISRDHPGTKRLADWLRSDVGQRTIASYAPEGEALFGPPGAVEEEVVEIAFDGDAEFGHKVSRIHCTRCHAVDDATRGWGIGSTPSFGILRAMPDWEARFTAFYVLKPHAAFTQIKDLTAPFPLDRPSPIAPVEMTLEEVEALLAYVAAMPAADLGKPLEHQ
ncbi:MAG: hypothetical protein AAGP08_12005 [Pseudomonadota bacterium]